MTLVRRICAAGAELGSGGQECLESSAIRVALDLITSGSAGRFGEVLLVDRVCGCSELFPFRQARLDSS